MDGIVGRERESCTLLEQGLEGLVPPEAIRYIPLIETVSLPFEWTPSQEWVVLTSPRAVSHFLPHLGGRALQPIVAIGSGTARALLAQGIQPRLTAPRADSEGLAEALLEYLERTGECPSFVQPTSTASGEEIQRRLQERGYPFRRLFAYETVPHHELSQCKERAPAEAVSWMAFFSPSGVQAWQGVGAPIPFGTAVSIGRRTSEALRSAGYSHIEEAPEPSMRGVLEAIRKTIRNSATTNHNL